MPKTAGALALLVRTRLTIPDDGTCFGRVFEIQFCTNTTSPAPSSGPITVAVPPMTTATRNSIESWKVWTLSALAWVSTSTEHEPAIPAYRALTANARTLTCEMLMPTVSAAGSWSRTAMSARPNRLRTMSSIPMSPTTTKASAQ